MLDQFKQVDTRRLYQRIADQIRSLIEDGRFADGERLPPERDLAQQLGVSRPSVREALIALEIEGIVEVRMGSGVFVCPPAKASNAPATPLGENPIELTNARAALEGSVVELACARATPELLEPVRRAVEAMRSAIAEGRSPLQHDREFHVAIASMTGNSVLVRLVGELFDGRHSPISSRVSARAESKQTWAKAFDEHESILHALENGEVLMAQAAMRTHLYASQRRWLEQERS
ncbi:FadR family transcriptional regulator [Burkholderia sp. Bp9143]|uniref:FadR/GntR family transcriptional regulator n=1 Tax=Burkholderia sp. Bp9143 TaxID=2184574 RepID=UPI000F591170|nr:FadR/GntR family transcriptional regulator [Burkholderia sp. Bp9143]RQR32756.1 FadR family transcriptional regulator [Burkholderia sp. Bp9143]